MRLQIFALAACLALIPAVHAQSDELGARPFNSPDPAVQEQAIAQSWQPRFTVLPAKNFNAETAVRQAGAAATVPLWSRTIGSAGTNYKYTMVGRNPFVALNTFQSLNIKAVVIPIKITFTASGNIVLDPTATDSTCSPKGTAAALTKASPIFNTISGGIWNTDVGTGEYVDLFQRANYYTQTNSTTGINPDYHTNLTFSQAAVRSYSSSTGEVVAGTCGNLGLMDINTWDSYLQNTLFPALAAASPQIAPPNTLPIFLLYNTVLYQGSTSNCCILGYHSAFNDPAYGGAFHAYASVEFDTNQSFTGVADVSAMSHEVAEWMDDPSGINPTPSWGNIGQVSGCQANLEVGDPLSGTLDQIYMASNKYTYHVQDLTFTSWFYGQKPSTGVNGWYSFLGTFTTPAAAC
ncbi:MAG TPA: hypothetical protein VKS60_24270 [Stellaceae bacterium]|nr:hypothetical protein [Stellaceae bacterium]